MLHLGSHGSKPGGEQEEGALPRAHSGAWISASVLVGVDDDLCFCLVFFILRCSTLQQPSTSFHWPEAEPVPSAEVSPGVSGWVCVSR